MKQKKDYKVRNLILFVKGNCKINTGCEKNTEKDKKGKHVHVNPIILFPHSTEESHSSTNDAVHAEEPSESVHVEPTKPVYVEPAIK
jgi:hypothetical protein